MTKKDIFKDVYNDFFGIDKLSKENEKLAEEISKLSNINLDGTNVPVIEVKKDNKKADTSASSDVVKDEVIDSEKSDDFMEKTFYKIDNLFIDDKSKELLKKVIEYMRKYQEKIEKNYISFDMFIETNNYEMVKDISNIILNAGVFFNYIQTGDGKAFSLYDVENPGQVDEIYTDNTALVILKDFESLKNQDQKFKDTLVHKLDEKISKNNEKTLTIITSKDIELVKQSLENNDYIIDKYFDFRIKGKNLDVQDVYQDVLKKINTNMEISSEEQIKLLDYISVTYPSATVPYNEYRDNLCEKIAFNKEIPEYEKEKSLEEIFAELNELVGLKKVKQVLKELVSLKELKEKAKNELKINNVNLHMCFLGNPGTGKTTVARIVMEILYNLKYIKQKKLIEVSSKDLVAEYVGQTAPKTMAVLQKAMGGVLFIDEAYSLASGSGNDNSFNDEAIATLVQGMENYRDNLVVIFAGYTKEMQAFLNSNSGIVSRIGYTLEFEDYTDDELIEIFNNMMTKCGFIVKNDAIERVRELIKQHRTSKNFGNARFIRNVYEKTVIKHSVNTQKYKSNEKLKTITANDISDENLL